MRGRSVCRGLTALAHQLSGIPITKAGFGLASTPPVWRGGGGILTSTSGRSWSGPQVRQQSNEADTSTSWEQLKRDGVRVNPCHSPHHPAAVEGVASPEGEERSLQVGVAGRNKRQTLPL
jgi:hypothetical protein